MKDGIKGRRNRNEGKKEGWKIGLHQFITGGEGEVDPV